MIEPQVCKVYLDHLRAEHLRIQRLVRKIREQLVAHEGSPCVAHLAEAKAELSQLRDELEHHFREEEGGGCLDEALGFKPSLASAVRAIEAEHPQILHAVDRLRLRLDEPAVAAGVCHWQREIDDLAAMLTAHEDAEARVLEQGFSVYLEDEPVRAD